MTTSHKVGELFKVAGSALCQLGQLTTQLHPSGEPPTPTTGKWTDQEIDLLLTCVKRFGEDLNQITDIIKNRTMMQIEMQMKKKAYEEAGLSPPPTQALHSTNTRLHHQTLISSQMLSPTSESCLTTTNDVTASTGMSDVTLSALNAMEADIDIEGFVGQPTVKKLKLDIDSDVDPVDL